jgi:prepilin-type N-terminal cleavage/methylation domain-containing protein
VKNFSNKFFISKKAFSLIELSVVIIILSIVISGMLSISINSAFNNKIKKTNDNIAAIYKAMGVYLLNNSQLPCPSSLKEIKYGTGSNIYGSAPSGQTSGTCANVDGVYNLQLASDSTVTNFVYGMVPVRDLGLPNDIAEDGFGSKFSYIIHKNYTSSSLFSSVVVSTTGIEVKKNVASTNSDNLGMFAIISHGQNRNGAFSAVSTTKNSEPSNNDEKDNSPYSLTSSSPYNATIYSDNLTSAIKIVLRSSSSDSTTTFDDILFVKSRNDMVKDFNAFHLIPCPAITAGYSDFVKYGTTEMLWSQAKYNSIAISTTDCPSGWKKTVKNPGRRCGTLGNWETGTDPSTIAIPCTQ